MAGNQTEQLITATCNVVSGTAETRQVKTGWEEIWIIVEARRIGFGSCPAEDQTF